MISGLNDCTLHMFVIMVIPCKFASIPNSTFIARKQVLFGKHNVLSKHRSYSFYLAHMLQYTHIQALSENHVHERILRS